MYITFNVNVVHCFITMFHKCTVHMIHVVPVCVFIAEFFLFSLGNLTSFFGKILPHLIL